MPTVDRECRASARRGPPRALAEIYAILAGVAGTRRLTPEEWLIIEICESTEADLEGPDLLVG
ncbi:MAG: hypothetical protein KY467_03800 [Gemmatimonadetes bacterium]|nr:hypothetical protein [Gemmatimonadota bacterium]